MGSRSLRPGHARPAQRARRVLDALSLTPAQLLTAPMQKLIDATRLPDPSWVEDTRLYFGPVLDDRGLARHPFYPDAPAQSAAIPMMIGNTRDETRAFLGQDSESFRLRWEDLPDRIRREQFVDMRPETVIAEYRRLYPDYSPSEVFFAATTAGRSWRAAIIEAEARAPGRTGLGLPARLAQSRRAGKTRFSHTRHRSDVQHHARSRCTHGRR